MASELGKALDILATVKPSDDRPLKPGTWVRKVGGDYEAEGQIVGGPMILDNGVIRYNIAIRKIIKGRLVHVVNPKHLELIEQEKNDDRA